MGTPSTRTRRSPPGLRTAAFSAGTAGLNGDDGRLVREAMGRQGCHCRLAPSHDKPYQFAFAHGPAEQVALAVDTPKLLQGRAFIFGLDALSNNRDLQLCTQPQNRIND